MSSPEMFGGSVQNFADPQSAMANKGNTSPPSPALDLKCYGSASAAASEPAAARSSLKPKSSSPATVISTPSPTERPETPAQPENLSAEASDKDRHLPPHDQPHNNPNIGAGPKESSGRCTPMPSREYIPSAHSESASTHPPPPSMLGPPSLYQPFSAARSGSYYPIEHYFPHPGNPAMTESRHAPPPPPIARTPPRSPPEPPLSVLPRDHSETNAKWTWQSTVVVHLRNRSGPPLVVR